MKNKKTLFAFLCIAMLYIALPARADNGCIDQCYSTFNCDTAGFSDGVKYECYSNRGTCLSRCSSNDNAARRGPNEYYYGAIAYDKKSLAWGMADEQKNQTNAKNSALKYCSEHGADCDVVESFSNQCAAVAGAADGTIAWAVEDTADEAQAKAVKKCNRGAANCGIQRWHCYLK